MLQDFLKDVHQARVKPRFVTTETPSERALSLSKHALTAMAEKMKLAKKSLHPPFSRMICETMHELDKTAEMDAKHPAHSLQSLKKYMESHYKVG